MDNKNGRCLLRFCLKISSHTLLVVFTMWLSACDRSDSASAEGPAIVQVEKDSVFDFSTHVGWVHGTCLAIKNNALETNQSIILVTFSDTQSLISAKIGAVTQSASGCYALLADRAGINQDQERVFYTLNIHNVDPDLIAIGVLATNAQFTQVGSTIESDLDSDGKNEVFTSCETSEGINFSIWKERPNQGEPVWTDYYYLGYDQKPTCP